MTEPNHFIGHCYRRDDGEPHPPHVVDFAHCGHEVTTWCYGVPESGSLEAQIASLTWGQRVRVVWEGVVDEPRVYHRDRGLVRDPAVLVSESNGSDHLVLRYTGQSFGRPDATPLKVAGQHNSGVVSIEVLADAAASPARPAANRPDELG